MKEIDRLRWKFMLYNMLIVTAVISITFISAAFLIKRRGYEEIDSVLYQAVQEREAEESSFQWPPLTRIPYFSAVVQTDGGVILQDGRYRVFPDENFLEQVVLMGLETENESGMLKEYHLRYLKVSRPTEDLIVFADTSYEEALMDGMLANGGIACGVIWLFFLGLSYLFARWAVRPVEEVMQHQKQFITDASHELKTPLTIIMANAQLLQDQCSGFGSETDKWMNNVIQECAQMRRLVENLLMLARNDIVKPCRADWKAFNFTDLVTEQILTFEPLFFQVGKSLDYQLPDSVWVKGNQEQLKQVIKILFDNAVKYSKENGKVFVCLEHSGKKRVCLWVKSEGTEISKEQRKAIFRRFYRGDASRSRQEGYGLGLAIAQAIVRNHRGDIGVECMEGKNCFYVKLSSVRGQ